MNFLCPCDRMVLSRRRCCLNACVLIIMTILGALALLSFHTKEYLNQDLDPRIQKPTLGTSATLYRTLRKQSNFRVNISELSQKDLNDSEEEQNHKLHSKEKETGVHQPFLKTQHASPWQSQASKSTAIDKTLVSRFPKFMIIGFGKAGTKALYEALKMHPSLSGPYKERRFFSLHYSNGIESYLKSFPSAPVGGHTIEKSPDYITDPQVPARIVESANSLGINPAELRFIVVLRDPIDRAMSEYIEWDILRKLAHKETLPKFDRMVLKSNLEIDESLPFLNASCYSYHIRNWLRVFPKEQMCYVDGDTFASNPYREIHILEECMGIRHFFTEENFVLDSSRGLYCFEVQNNKTCLGKNKGRKHPDIAPQVVEKLKRYFHHWNEELFQLTGRHVHWDEENSQ